MIFGNPSQVAIETTEVRISSEIPILGLTLWVSGIRLGDPSEGLMLGFPFSWMQHYLSQSPKRMVVGSQNKSDAELFQYYYLDFNEQEKPTKEQGLLRSIFRMDVCFQESFCSDRYIGLICIGNECGTERVIWSYLDAIAPCGHSFELGTLDACISSFLRWATGEYWQYLVKAGYLKTANDLDRR